ncbi:hypothetical protein PQR12_23630 [Paraburkholderia nemoris]|uniref:hypothetical protein n=1 Tax=Paraburkholderia nemoris TaxID=2793076 RepID=UPI0038BA7C39
MDSTASNAKRNTLRVLAGIAALAAQGRCLPTELCPSPSLESLPKVSRPIFKPSRISNNGKLSSYCIDVHAHIFNASDIDVVGFVAKDVAHDIESPALRRFVERLAKVAGTLARLAPPASSEIKRLGEYLLQQADLSVQSLNDFLLSETDQHRRMVAKELAVAMQQTGLDREFLKLQRMHVKQMRLTFGQLAARAEPPSTFNESTVLTAIDPPRRVAEYQRLYGNLQQPQISHDPGGPLEFIGHMLAYRWMNLRDYAKFYTEADSAYGIDAVFVSFVNFDYWLNPVKRSSQFEQMQLHALLSQMSGGYMLPLVAYNPWTDIEEDNSSFNMVRTAICDYGFIGVKIYPPMGFYPFGNATLPNKSNESNQTRPDGALLDKKLLQMFTWCAANHVPVMAHSGESMGRDLESDEFGGPLGWRELLTKLANAADPPVANLAHFGGGSKSGGHQPNDWTIEFATFMKGEGGKHLYGDLAYWDELRWCDSRHPDCKTAKSRIGDALAKNKGTAKRLMFGTDWHMLSREPDWPSYPRQVTANLRGALPSMDDFLYRNALECFGLGPRGAQYDRIVGSLKKVPGGLPAWLVNSSNK